MKILNTPMQPLNQDTKIEVLTLVELVDLLTGKEISALIKIGPNTLNISTMGETPPVILGQYPLAPPLTLYMVRVTDGTADDAIEQLFTAHPYLVITLDEYLSTMLNSNMMSTLHISQLQHIPEEEFPMLATTSCFYGQQMKFRYVKLESRQSAIESLQEFGELHEKAVEKTALIDLFHNVLTRAAPEIVLTTDHYQAIDLKTAKLIITTGNTPTDDEIDDEVIARIRNDYPMWWPVRSFFIWHDNDELEEIDNINDVNEAISNLNYPQPELLPNPPAVITLENPTPSAEK